MEQEYYIGLYGHIASKVLLDEFNRAAFKIVYANEGARCSHKDIDPPHLTMEFRFKSTNSETRDNCLIKLRELAKQIVGLPKCNVVLLYEGPMSWQKQSQYREFYAAKYGD